MFAEKKICKKYEFLASAAIFERDLEKFVWKKSNEERAKVLALERIWTTVTIDNRLCCIKNEIDYSWLNVYLLQVQKILQLTIDINQSLNEFTHFFPIIVLASTMVFWLAMDVRDFSNVRSDVGSFTGLKIIPQKWSNFHWLVLSLFCVFFVQWSMFPSG